MGSFVVTRDLFFKHHITVDAQQHGFQQCRSTYTQIFFNSEYRSTIWPTVGWIHRSGTMDMKEPQIRCELYPKTQVSTPQSPMLFKGQLYFKSFKINGLLLFYRNTTWTLDYNQNVNLNLKPLHLQDTFHSFYSYIFS